MKVTSAELRERSKRVLSQVRDVRDVRMGSLSCEARRPGQVGKTLRVVTGIEVEGGSERWSYDGEDHIEVIVSYDLTASPEGEVGEPAWSLKVSMIGTWAVAPTDEPIEALDLNCFALAIGAMTVHPYARETVQSTISRLGYPGFTMDMLFNPTSAPDDHIFDVPDVAGPT